MKRFLCIWTLIYSDSVQIVAEDFFTAENGYDQSDIDDIKKLEVGNPYTVECNQHHIVRLRDKEDQSKPVMFKNDETLIG